MRLLSFAEGNRQSWGAVFGDAVIDLGHALPQFATLANFLGSNEYGRRDRIAAELRPGPGSRTSRFCR